MERSRFVCTLERASTADDAHAFVREMNAEFGDATHNCWAFVAGPPGSMDRIGMSDDGEPHGTAGRPMLTALVHSGIGDIAAVVTRYYGGTKLGTGGLVKAYGGAVQHALQELSKIEKVARVDLEVTIAYPHIAAVQQALAAYEAEVVEQVFGTEVVFMVRMPAASLEPLRAAVADATRGDGRVSEGSAVAP